MMRSSLLTLAGVLLAAALLTIPSVASAQEPPRPWPPGPEPTYFEADAATAPVAPPSPDVTAQTSARAVLNRIHYAEWARTVFTSAREEGIVELYIGNGSGPGATRITRNNFAEARPSLHPNLSLVAFDADANGDGLRELYLIRTDGSELREIAPGPGSSYNAEWSPDGTRLAFVSNRSGNAEIYLFVLGSGAVTQISHNPAADFDPAWYGENLSLAWVRAVSEMEGVIIKRPPDGAEYTVSRPFIHLNNLALSPSGAKAVFTCLTPFPNDMIDPWYDICSVDWIPGEGTVQRLRQAEVGQDFSVNTWSPVVEEPGRFSYLYTEYLWRLESNVYVPGSSRIWIGHESIFELDDRAVLLFGGPTDADAGVRSGDLTLPLAWTEPVQTIADELTLPEWNGLDTTSTLYQYELRFTSPGRDPVTVRTRGGELEWGTHPPIQRCQPYTFEVRAQDWARNWGSWSPIEHRFSAEDMIIAKAEDARGRPIPFAAVQEYGFDLVYIGDAQGRFSAYRCDRNSFHFAMRSPGFIELEPNEGFSFSVPAPELHTWRMYTGPLVGPNGFDRYGLNGERWTTAGWRSYLLFCSEMANICSIGDLGILGEVSDEPLPQRTRSTLSASFFLTDTVDSHAPTFSFDVRSEGAADTPNRLRLTLLAEGATEPVTLWERRAATSAWRHEWVDLSQYAGQHFTLTFALETASNVAPSIVYLLEGRVSDWKTPVVTAATPELLESATVQAGAVLTMAIEGQNFMTPLTVTIGGLPAPVISATESRIVAQIPPALGSGHHDVIVQNAGGQTGALASALHVDRSTWLPAVRRR